jgi:hypothetical protein
MEKIDAIFDTEIPEGFERPARYLILGEIPSDLRSATFGRGGKDSLIWIHIWHNGLSEDGSIELGKRLPLAIKDDIEYLLDQKRVPLDQWTMLLGEVNLIRLDRDPHIPYMHGVVQYRILGKAPVAL